MGCSHQFSWLSLALEIRILTDVLILQVEKEEPGQMEMFPIDISTRQRFLNLANTFSACLKNAPEGLEGLPSSAFHSLEFYRYEMFGFVQKISDSEWLTPIAIMLGIAGGEPFSKETYLTLIEFFDGLERAAIHLTRTGGM